MIVEFLALAIASLSHTFSSVTVRVSRGRKRLAPDVQLLKSYARTTTHTLRVSDASGASCFFPDRVTSIFSAAFDLFSRATFSSLQSADVEGRQSSSARSPVVHEQVRDPQPLGGDAHAIDLAVRRLVPLQVVVVPFLGEGGNVRSTLRSMERTKKKRGGGRGVTRGKVEEDGEKLR